MPGFNSADPFGFEIPPLLLEPEDRPPARVEDVEPREAQLALESAETRRVAGESPAPDTTGEVERREVDFKPYVPDIVVPPVSEDLKKQVNGIVDRLGQVREDAVTNPDTPSEDREALGITGSQADFASLVLSGLQERLAADTRAGRLSAPEGGTHEAGLEGLRERPSVGAVRKLVLERAEVGPTKDSDWDLLTRLQPGDALAKASELPKTEDEFFKGLKLKPPEVDMHWELKDGAQGAEEQRASDQGFLSRARFNLVDRFVYPQGPSTDYGRDKFEALELRNVRISFGSQLGGGNVEAALNVVASYIEKQNDREAALNRRAHPDEAFRGELEPVVLHGFVDRWRTYMGVAYRLRVSRLGAEKADKGLQRDLERFIELRQQVRSQSEFARAEKSRQEELALAEKSEESHDYVNGRRELKSLEQRQDEALLGIIKLQNQILYGREEDYRNYEGAEDGNNDSSRVGNLVLEALADLISTDQEVIRDYHQDPSAVLGGDFPRLGPEEFNRQIEKMAALYRLAAGRDRVAAERTLAQFCNQIVVRLRSEARAAGRLDGDDMFGFSMGNDFRTYPDSDLRRVLSETLSAAEQQLREYRVVSDLTTERLKKIRRELWSREQDPSGRANLEHKKLVHDEFQRHLADTYPGDILIYSGAVDGRDGQPGVLALALAAQGAREISLLGGGPLMNSTLLRLGQTAINRLSATPNATTYKSVIVEGRASTIIKPSHLLNYIAPNGFGAVGIGMNVALAARLILMVDHKGYDNSIMPKLVKGLPLREQRSIEELKCNIQGLERPQDVRWAILPSTVCRFTAPDGNSLRVDYGSPHQPEDGRRPSLTLALFRDKGPGVPSDLYNEVVRSNAMDLVTSAS